VIELDTTDIRTVDGIDCIVFSLRSLNGTTDKQLKTTASDRLIPVHPTLIDCGLLLPLPGTNTDRVGSLRGHAGLTTLRKG
jgi:hypothetical protein